jgi:hypothetical protein
MNGAERNNKYACIFTASVAINRKKCAARHGTYGERERERERERGGKVFVEMAFYGSAALNCTSLMINNFSFSLHFMISE